MRVVAALVAPVFVVALVDVERPCYDFRFGYFDFVLFLCTVWVTVIW